MTLTLYAAVRQLWRSVFRVLPLHCLELRKPRYVHNHNDKDVSDNISTTIFLNRSYCSVVSVRANVTYKLFVPKN